MSSSYLVLDLETGSKESFGRKGNPFDPENKIVAIGLKHQGKIKPFSDYANGYELNISILLSQCLMEVGVLVGHNIKYDLLYLWKYKALQDWLEAGGRIFDTQLAEYILSGQRHKYPSLREIAVNKYGCKERPKHMEEYWDKGIDTSKIPKELVLEDVRNDVLDTEAIMLQQIPELKKQGMYRLAMECMEGLLATVGMEYNGLYVDKQIFQANKQKIEEEIKEIEVGIEIMTRKYGGINYASTNDMSLLFFGGIKKEECQVPILNELGVQEVYKTGAKRGQTKTKKGIKEVQIKGFGLKPKEEWKLKKEGFYSTDEKVLKHIAKKPKTDAGKVALLMLQLREKQKLLGTYYDGFNDLIYPDSCIRGNIGMVATDTGRTNSSRPNLQNIPKG